MESKLNPFEIYDVVLATDAAIQHSHFKGLPCPPTDLCMVVAIHGDRLVFTDGGEWPASFFEKVGENVALKQQVEDSQAFIEYGFREDELVGELARYIDKTYGQHYAKDGVQAFSLISKRPLRGLNFALSNVIKYADRFGEKKGMNRDDLLKVAHYAILALYSFDALAETQQ